MTAHNGIHDDWEIELEELNHWIEYLKVMKRLSVVTVFSCVQDECGIEAIGIPHLSSRKNLRSFIRQMVIDV